MLQRSFAGLEFELIGTVQPERQADGPVREFMPQSRYAKASTVPLNPNGAGPFCRFRVARDVHEPGVYVLTLDGTPVYAGKCTDLAERWGPRGYGAISPKNCFVGGQSTNCKVNNRALVHCRTGKQLELWFHHTTDITVVERRVVVSLDPPWNAHVPS